MEEQWKQIPEYPKYEASNLGKIRNIKTGRILKQAYLNSGYSIVSMRIDGITKTVPVHRLVMLAFDHRDNVSKLNVNHKDWDKTNNRLDNLEWVTAQENMLHGSGPHELKVLETMLINTLKKTIHNWYDALKSVDATKEAFTEKVIEEAFEGAVKSYLQVQ